MRRLSDVDHQILAFVDQHRVLTTSLIIQLLSLPERTVDYRLLRLYKLGLLGRTRPYVDKGTAPFFWWLSAAGARLTNGTSPGAGKRTPNPLFLAHASATAALWAALVANGPGVGLEPVAWLREEGGWEEFDAGTLVASMRKLRPDARVEVRSGSGEPVRSFIEIDMGTMDQGRLATKVTRFLDYHASTAWVDRHKHCPGLLLLTTSDARTRTFIERARKAIKSKHSVYSSSQPAIVAACGPVRDPMSAVTERSWQIAGDPELVTLREVFDAIDDRRSEYFELIRQEEQEILRH